MPAQTSPILAVVFDLDDTLYPERDYVRSGYRAVADALGQPARADEFFHWLWNRFLRGQPAGALDALSEEFALNLDKPTVNRLVTLYRSHPCRLAPYGGLADLLSLLRPHYRLGVLSDAFAPGGRMKLDALGLERFFDAAVFTDELGPDRQFWKPSPVGYERIAQALGVPVAACAFIGDNPSKDFQAPNALGALTIQYLQPGQLSASKAAPPGGEPQHIARNPGEIVQALRP
ncbi:MAG: HAD family hydrolase [Planctomycetota bacterium]|nr:HAD family hydrolase [Planctomycetota bacterium]